MNRAYVRQFGNQVWMPEIGLGIGCQQSIYEGLAREWLYWYDQQGNRLLAPDSVIQQERQRAEQERQRAVQEQQRAEQERQRAEQGQQRAEQAEQQAEQERRLREELIARLRERGIDLDAL